MKVLFVNLHDDPGNGGGVEVTIQTLVHGVKQAGIEPVMLSTTPSRGIEMVEHNGIRHWRAGIRNIYWPDKKRKPSAPSRFVWHMLDSYNLLMQGYLRTALEAERPDVVSLHNLAGWSAATWQSVGHAQVPSVQVLHDHYLLCPRTTMFRDGANCSSQCMQCRLFRLPHRSLSNRVSAVVGISNYILERHLAMGYFGTVPTRRVIHNARNLSALDHIVNKHVEEVSENVRVGFIGRLDPTKGIETLLDTFAMIDAPDLELWVAGTGEERYERWLRSTYSSPDVTFVGHVTPAEFFPKLDFVVVPSLLEEALGMVAVEALAFGKPVIGSRRGGIPDIVQHEVNGLLFDPNHPDELRVAITRLVVDTKLRMRMSDTARSSAQSFLNMDRWIEGYTELYAAIQGASGTVGAYRDR